MANPRKGKGREQSQTEKMKNMKESLFSNQREIKSGKHGAKLWHQSKKKVD